MNKYSQWEFLAESKEAAIDLLLKQQRTGWCENATDEDYAVLIKGIEALDLSMPPPADEGSCLSDGWRWLVKVEFMHKESGPHYWPEFTSRVNSHELTVNRVIVMYGLTRAK
jgi:hypothetical protein